MGEVDSRPGFIGMNPKLFKVPQPLATPGSWEEEIQRLSTEECQFSTEPVISLHEQVNHCYFFCQE